MSQVYRYSDKLKKVRVTIFKRLKIVWLFTIYFNLQYFLIERGGAWRAWQEDGRESWKGKESRSVG
jgi:hypothetical protein